MKLISVFIFYNKSSGNQAKLSFSKEFKHCNIITYDGTDWIMLDFDRSGFHTRRIKCENGDKLVKNLRIIKYITAIVSVSIEERVKVWWKPYLVRSCNEICRYATGIDIGFTFNPVHLYRKLLHYSGKRNFEVLSVWRRKMGFDDDEQQSEADEMINEEIRNNRAELEAKKESLFQTRLDIIKGQGNQIWEPNRGVGISGRSSRQQQAKSAGDVGGMIEGALKGSLGLK